MRLAEEDRETLDRVLEPRRLARRGPLREPLLHFARDLADPREARRAAGACERVEARPQ